MKEGGMEPNPEGFSQIWVSKGRKEGPCSGDSRLTNGREACIPQVWRNQPGCQANHTGSEEPITG